jgi:hypothetical protein
LQKIIVQFEFVGLPSPEGKLWRSREQDAASKHSRKEWLQDVPQLLRLRLPECLEREKKHFEMDGHSR